MSDFVSYHILDDGRRTAGLDITTVWAAYFALGGDESADTIEAYLHGEIDLARSEVEILSIAVAEGAAERGIQLPSLTAPLGLQRDPVELASDDGLIAMLSLTTAGADFAAGNLAFILTDTGLVEIGSPGTGASDAGEPDRRTGTMISIDTRQQGAWEVHPAGDETLIPLSGGVRVEFDGQHGPPARVDAGAALVVPRNRWHRHSTLSRGTRLLKVTPLRGSLER